MDRELARVRAAILNPKRDLSATEIADIDTQIAPYRLGIEALRFYVATTRGWRARERKAIVKYMREVAGLQAYSDAQLLQRVERFGFVDYGDWRDGDVARYQELLDAVPSEHLPRLREAALGIARGSGRKPIDGVFRVRAETEFGNPPRACAWPLGQGVEADN